MAVDWLAGKTRKEHGRGLAGKTPKEHKSHHIDFAMKNQGWPHEIQPIGSKPLKGKHSVGCTGSSPTCGTVLDRSLIGLQ
jgi:hypothetical protein